MMLMTNQSVCMELHLLVTVCTPPLKKVQDAKNFIRLLTLLFSVIYQANQDLGGPGNGGWENFAQLQNFQVK